MIKLGVSLYPEQENMKDIDVYLAMASRYGFTKVFTSLFSVEGDKKEVMSYFKNLTDIAHKYGMVVCGDCNGIFFDKVNATETDLSPFVEMGIDIIRMDFSFNDERDAVLINNEVGIKIELSTAMIDVIEKAVKNGANLENISTCHNFYPQRYSAPSIKKINEVNEYWKKRKVSIAMFISSNNENTHGPWPVSDGLVTVEEHRNLSIDVQLKHCLALNNVNEVLIANAYASEDEFKAIHDVMEQAYVTIPLDPNLSLLADHIPHGDLVRRVFSIQLEEGLSAIEKEILFNYPTHCDMGDCLNYFLRSRCTRILYKNQEIPMRTANKSHYTKGDVVIVNDNLKYYRAEVQVVLKDMKIDGQRNLLGHISEDELFILDYLGAKDVFTFVEKEN